MTCPMPLCSRDASGESGPLCWPCWSRERDLKKRGIPCQREGCEAIARVVRYLTPRIRRVLCLKHGWELHRWFDQLRSFAGPQKPISEIEEDYAWRGADRR